MPNLHGDFVWYELITTDADAAQKFYGGLLGWTFENSDQSDMDYRLFAANGLEVGGVMPLTSEMQQGGAQALWTGYVGVDDVDASGETIKNAGGETLMGPVDIPGVGRFVFVKDPQGASLYIMQPADSAEPSQSFAHDKPRNGHCAWNELMTSDPESAIAFYGNAFGWVKADSMDMGPMGEYRMLKNGNTREFQFGGVMKKPDEMPASLWNYYFRVPNVDDAVRYVNNNGGQIVNGPMEIPGNEFTLNGIDPQGAFFSLVGKR